MQTSTFTQPIISSLNQTSSTNVFQAVVNKGSILMVDDDTFLLDMYSNRLKKAGHDAVTCASGEEALEVLRSGKEFDLMLLDVIMPGMSGFELLENMKEENLAKDTIKVILSNMGDQSAVVEKGQNFAITKYVVKAESTPSDVLNLVDRLLG